jgi:Tol biopolymer transport system component
VVLDGEPSEESGALEIIDPDDSSAAPIRVLDSGGGPAAWSPDGTRLTFTTYGEDFAFAGHLFVIEPSAGADAVELTDDSFRGLDHAWSPDSSVLAFAALAAGERDSTSLVLLDPDGGHGETLVEAPNALGGLDWSPDGRSIAFGETVEGGAIIRVIDVASRAVRDVTSPDAAHGDYFPQWAPDGTRIAFERASGGVEHLVVVNRDGSGLVSLAEGVEVPSWLRE